MSREIDDLVLRTWQEHYDRLQPMGIMLIDLALTCSRCSGYRWYAKVTRGYGASGHGKHETPHEAVNRAIEDYDRNRKAWESLPGPKLPPMLEDEQCPLNLDGVIPAPKE